MHAFWQKELVTVVMEKDVPPSSETAVFEDVPGLPLLFFFFFFALQNRLLLRWAQVKSLQRVFCEFAMFDKSMTLMSGGRERRRGKKKKKQKDQAMINNIEKWQENNVYF